MGLVNQWVRFSWALKVQNWISLGWVCVIILYQLAYINLKKNIFTMIEIISYPLIEDLYGLSIILSILIWG